jgi:sugar phosphate permease
MLAGLCAMYMITYIDRVNISTTAPVLQKDLALSETELGLVFSAFAVPYGILQPFGGWVIDSDHVGCCSPSAHYGRWQPSGPVSRTA